MRFARLFERYEERSARLPVDGPRPVTASRRVLDQDHIPATEASGLPVTDLDLDRAVEKDDELPPWRRVPVVVVVGIVGAEDHPPGAPRLRQRPDRAGVLERDLDLV